MSKKENLKLNKTDLKKKYGDTVVRGVPQELVARVLNKKIYTPAGEAMFTIRDMKGGVTHTPLLMSMNLGMEDKLRCEAEIDPTWKQVIPYVIVRYDDKIFCTHRLGGDARLTGSYSIGTGGHIDSGERIYDAMRRELNEEVGVKEKDILAYVVTGYILDESSEVNSVHLGVVIDMVITRDDISCLEKEKLQGEWITREQLKKLYDEDKLESWSKIVFENIFIKELV